MVNQDERKMEKSKLNDDQHETIRKETNNQMRNE